MTDVARLGELLLKPEESDVDRDDEKPELYELYELEDRLLKLLELYEEWLELKPPLLATAEVEAAPASMAIAVSAAAIGTLILIMV